MNKEQTKIEKDLAREINEFLEVKGWSLSKLCNHPQISYSNLDKMNDFLQGRSTITMRVAGRFRSFIDRYPKDPRVTSSRS